MIRWISISILAGLVIGMVLTIGCTSTNSYIGSVINPYQFRVSYPGRWTGMCMGCGLTSPNGIIAGKGTKTYDLPDWDAQDEDILSGFVYINIIKLDVSSQPLTVELLKSGNVIESNTTYASFGSAKYGSQEAATIGYVRKK